MKLSTPKSWKRWKTFKSWFSRILIFVVIVGALGYAGMLISDYWKDTNYRKRLQQKLPDTGKKLDPISLSRLQWDTIRHYYPVVQGEELEIAYTIKNQTPDTPLFIREIQTSCGCLDIRSQLPVVILPNDSGYVRLNFDTHKNTGYVCHYIDCYGNISEEPHCITLVFDTHVVPPADYTRDYEEVWHQQNGGISGAVRDFVNGTSSQKGYWTPADTLHKHRSIPPRKH